MKFKYMTIKNAFTRFVYIRRSRSALSFANIASSNTEYTLGVIAT